MPTSAEERRFTLLTLLSRQRATIDQIAQLPAYRGHHGIAQQRLIERDIQILRESGTVVRVDKDYRYSVDTSHRIAVDLQDLDLTILRRLLGTKRRNNVEAFAQYAATKALGQGIVTDKMSAYKLKVPYGDSVVDIAQALGQHTQISFTYTKRDENINYIVEPWRIEVHFGAFYMVAAVIERDGSPVAGDARTFKLSRIVGKVIMLDSPVTIERKDNFDSTLSPVDIEVFVADPAMPLAQRGQIIAHHDGGVIVRFPAADRWDIVDDVLFHADAARIVAPAWLRDDVNQRIDHVHEVLNGIW
ncbi:helix-turn-helix transcriptional regulator [Arcanobacterium pinnipediorum]|uniref:WYL domain-containing protein n=1 Tax=Arcanobacterium pinnipediorum TaxID=1503041 RepID=A0ABY5AFH8_9ACTO|nr:WYL domain-containing protein [Arcanobacterium pinnipediorum]USR78630.1 WYL domain-containing protein [Arcanobacterium pinnipediorum]